MKLVKLSLAAVVTVGTMTTYASATPLEDAIKGVEISGIARYRFYHESDKLLDDNGSQENRFSGELNIISPISDNLKFGMTLAIEHKDFASNDASSSGNIDVDRFWFQYAIGDLTIKAGKMEIPTPWTESGFDGTRGNGILALYSGFENFTFAVAYYNQTNKMNDANIRTYDFATNSWQAPIEDFDNGLGLGQEDLMAAAVIGKVGFVDLQVWMAKMEHAIDYTAFGEVGFNHEGFSLKGQLNYLKLASELKNDFKDDTGIFYGFEGGYENDMFFVNAGYTKTDDDMPIYVLDGDNDGFIKFGQQLYLLTQNSPDIKTYFAKAGFNYDKFGFEAGYGYADVNMKSSDKDEFYALVTYSPYKNLSLNAYYSVLNSDIHDEENNELQFEIEYNF